MHKRTDLNQQEIIDSVKKIGASVFSLSDVGKGIPDLLIGFRNKNFLFEIKRPGCRYDLTKSQHKLHNEWRGIIHVAESIDEVLDIITS